MTPGLALRLGGAILALAAAFLAGWSSNGWRLGVKTEHDARIRAEAAGRELASAVAQRDALAQKLADADKQHTQELEGKNDEIENLRTCMRNGTCGLRIATAAPVCPSTPAQEPARPGVDSGTGAILTPDAESDYFALRKGLARFETKLAACQDQLRLRAVPSAP